MSGAEAEHSGKPGAGRVIVAALARLLALLPVAWGAAALWFDGPTARPLAMALAAVYALLSLWLLSRRPARRGLLLCALPFVVLLAWWFSLAPRADRDWQDDVARTTRADIAGDIVTLHDVRHFVWRSDDDYDIGWETRTYDLSKVTGVDLFVCQWGPTEIAHTIMSWQFADARPLAISIETRKERGEEYSPVRGFFRQFELYYVVADERDVVGVRTACRGEDVRLYRLAAPPERARKLLLLYLEEVNSLAREPEWYNAFSANCTTQIFNHVYHLMGYVPADWRILLNGHLDELLQEEGSINGSMPIEELRRASYISDKGRDAVEDEDFPERIREGLPARPPPPPR